VVGQFNQSRLSLGVRDAPLAEYAALAQVSQHGIRRWHYAPLPANDDSEAPPLGFAIAQLKSIYVLAENAQGWCWSTCTRRTSASPTRS
jgi:DNA mismatch repair protein MutL